VEIDKKIVETRKKLAKLKDSGSEAWDEMKSGLNQAMDDLEKAYNDAKTKFDKGA
jgi:hypothetical protein